jgi:hypothetical protein
MVNTEADVGAGRGARPAYGPQGGPRRDAEVRVISAELGAGRGGDTRRVVRACVYLDTLLPADVRVELVSGRPGEDASRTRATDVRLWSVLSYGNGSFLFESAVPALELGAGESVGVRVALRDDDPWGAQMHPVVRWLPTSELADAPRPTPRRPPVPNRRPSATRRRGDEGPESERAPHA